MSRNIILKGFLKSSQHKNCLIFSHKVITPPLGLIPVNVSHHFEKGYSTGVIKKYIAAKIRASQEIQDKKPIIQNSKFKIQSSKILTHYPVFNHLANFTMAIN